MHFLKSKHCTKFHYSNNTIIYSVFFFLFDSYDVPSKCVHNINGIFPVHLLRDTFFISFSSDLILFYFRKLTEDFSDDMVCVHTLCSYAHPHTEAKQLSCKFQTIDQLHD